MPMSRMVGFRRDEISALTDRSGVRTVSTIVHASASPTPIASDFRLLRSSSFSLVRSTPIASATIGAISGARIIAPMITGPESANRPRAASIVERIMSTTKDSVAFALSRRTRNRSRNSSVVARLIQGRWRLLSVSMMSPVGTPFVRKTSFGSGAVLSSVRCRPGMRISPPFSTLSANSSASRRSPSMLARAGRCRVTESDSLLTCPTNDGSDFAEVLRGDNAECSTNQSIIRMLRGA